MGQVGARLTATATGAGNPMPAAVSPPVGAGSPSDADARRRSLPSCRPRAQDRLFVHPDQRVVSMKIVVGFLSSPEGRVALTRAVSEAKLRNAELRVVHSIRGGERDQTEQMFHEREEFGQLKAQLDESGVAYRLVEYARSNAPADDLLQAAEDERADLIVIGIRRRSPVGKLILGSNAQNVLLNADCAVLAVKPAAEDQ